jgi:hypothetical protein
MYRAWLQAMCRGESEVRIQEQVLEYRYKYEYVEGKGIAFPINKDHENKRTSQSYRTTTPVLADPSRRNRTIFTLYHSIGSSAGMARPRTARYPAQSCKRRKVGCTINHYYCRACVGVCGRVLAWVDG